MAIILTQLFILKGKSTSLLLANSPATAAPLSLLSSSGDPPVPNQSLVTGVDHWSPQGPERDESSPAGGAGG